eukprot:tig00000889_g5290.t1
MVVGRIPAGPVEPPLTPVHFGGYAVATPDSSIRASLPSEEGEGAGDVETLVTVPIRIRAVDETKEATELKERLLKLLGRQKTIERLEATSHSLASRLQRSLRLQGEVEASLRGAGILNACCSSNFDGIASVAGCFRSEQKSPRAGEKEGDELTRDLWRLQQEQAKDLDEICGRYAGRRKQEAAKEAAIVEMERQMRSMEEQLEGRSRETAALREELLEAQRAAQELQAAAEDLSLRLQHRDAECQHALDAQQNLLRENARAKQSVGETQQALASMQEFLQDMHVKVKGQLGKKDDEIRDLKRALAHREDECARLRQQLSTSWRESDQAIGRELDWKLEYGRLVKEAGSLRAELEAMRAAGQGGDSQRSEPRARPAPGAPPEESMSLTKFIMRTFGGGERDSPPPPTPPLGQRGFSSPASYAAGSEATPEARAQPPRYYDGVAIAQHH